MLHFSTIFLIEEVNIFNHTHPPHISSSEFPTMAPEEEEASVRGHEVHTQ